MTAFLFLSSMVLFSYPRLFGPHLEVLKSRSSPCNWIDGAGRQMDTDVPARILLLDHSVNQSGGLDGRARGQESIGGRWEPWVRSWYRRGPAGGRGGGACGRTQSTAAR